MSAKLSCSYIGLLFVLANCNGQRGEEADTTLDASMGHGQTSGDTQNASGSGTGDSNNSSPPGPGDACVGKACGESCSFCYSVDNGMCATDAAIRVCNVEGECVIDLRAIVECPGNTNACADKQCGETCDLCPPGVSCPIGEGLCGADGVCDLVQPECPAQFDSGGDSAAALPNADAGDARPARQ